MLIAKGDKFAFREFYALFQERVYNTAISYVQNVADAEEITQDVFLKIYKNALKFKGTAAVSTWIYRITVNTALNVLKKRQRFSFFKLGREETAISDFDHPGILLEKKEDAKILFAEIKRLPSNQQTAFILSFIEGLPRQKVAAIMDTTLKAVESLLQRAKKNLRVQLEKRLT
ncbi:MAG: RNA polymerase sigma factor [Saprospiraceae bacterium]